MNKVSKYFEYAYLAIAVVFIIEGISKFSEEREKAYLSFVFSAFAIFMYFFKRKFRQKRSK